MTPKKKDLAQTISNFRIKLTGLRLCLMRAANRRLASPLTPAWSLASHHSMTRASSTVSLPNTKAASSETHQYI